MKRYALHSLKFDFFWGPISKKKARRMIKELVAAGDTRWTLYHFLDKGFETYVYYTIENIPADFF